MKTTTNKSKERMIHVRIPAELHKLIRLKVAQLDTSMQKWMIEVLTREAAKKD